MRHKYATRALVLGRTSLREQGSMVVLLTEELGLLRARAEGLRKPGSKLAHALQTFSECDATLLRGKDGWRLSGAILIENWFGRLKRPARERAGRVAGLLLRLVHGEAHDPALFELMHPFLVALPDLGEEEADAAECFAALRLLAALGLDAGALPGGSPVSYDPASLTLTREARQELVLRINRGISASGL
jgi:recombinational DNA repair protein (RecF pathway)